MTKAEQRLFEIIRHDENPQEALMIAIGIIYDYLKQPQSYQQASVGHVQELA